MYELWLCEGLLGRKQTNKWAHINSGRSSFVEVQFKNKSNFRINFALSLALKQRLGAKWKLPIILIVLVVWPRGSVGRATVNKKWSPNFKDFSPHLVPYSLRCFFFIYFVPVIFPDWRRHLSSFVNVKKACLPISVPSVNILPVGAITRIIVKNVEFAGKWLMQNVFTLGGATMKVSTELLNVYVVYVTVIKWVFREFYFVSICCWWWCLKKIKINGDETEEEVVEEVKEFWNNNSL